MGPVERCVMLGTSARVDRNSGGIVGGGRHSVHPQTCGLGVDWFC